MQLDYSSSVQTFETNEFTAYLNQLEDCIQKVQQYIYELEGEQSSIPKRKYLLKSDLIVNIIFLLLVLGVDTLLSGIISTPAGGLLSQTIEIWIACITLLAASLYLIYRTTKSVIILAINHSNRFLQEFVSKKGIHTLIEEENFCYENIKTYNLLLNNLQATKKAIASNTLPLLSHNEINSLLNQASKEFPKFQYNGNKLTF